MNSRMHFYVGLGFLLSTIILVWLLARSSITPPPPVVGSAPSVPATLRFGHNSPVDSALHAAALRFADEIGRKSSGKVVVTVHPLQELGNDDQMLEMARQGSLDILLTPTAKMSVAVPAMQYADLPFYFPSREALYRMLDGEPGRLLLEKLRPIGLEGVAFWENGFKHFTANRPIHSPADFKGLKIRTMKSRIIMHSYEEMGAIPVLIDFHETRKALGDRVVDGQENPLVAIVGMKIHEVQSHLTLSSHGYLGYVLSISSQTFQNLSGDIRTMLLSTGRELVAFERAETRQREEHYLDVIRQAGVTIHTLTDAERHAFTERCAELPRQFEPIIGPDILSRTEEVLRDELPAEKREQDIVVGFDGDLSTVGIRSALGIKRGAMLAMDEINHAGGVLGRKFKLLSRDNKAMPSVGLLNFRELASKPEVVAIMGSSFSNIAQLQAKEAQKMGLLNLVPWAAAAAVVETKHDQGPNFTFRVSANDRMAGPFLVDTASRQFGEVALVLENSLWGRGNYESMSQFLLEQGKTPKKVVWFNRGETHWEPVWDSIGDSGAQSIVLVANSVEGAALVKTMIKSIDKGKKMLPIISHWGIVSGEFWSRVAPIPPEIDIRVLQTFSFTKKPGPDAERVLTSYKQFFHATGPDDVMSPVGTAHAYDLIHLLAQAITKAGTTERRAVRDAMEHLGDTNGLVKHYSPPFTPERHDALGTEDYFFARFRQDGQLVPETH